MDAPTAAKSVKKKISLKERIDAPNSKEITISGIRDIQRTNHSLPDALNPSATILVVDDEEFLLRYVRLVLVRAGYSVLTALNGEEAWSLIQDNRQEIRLILTDIVMPGSFDGFELAERVRKRQPDLPVLLMTGAPPNDHPSADDLDWQWVVLRKPFFPDQLLTMVRENLDAASRLV